MNSSSDYDAQAAYQEGIKSYINSLIHRWSRTLAIVGFILIPLLYIFDLFIIPQQLFARFAFYRFVATFFIIIQYIVIFSSKPRLFSRAHGYFFSAITSLMISIMCCELGGFDSPYYAGLNIILVTTNLLLPWEAFHSAINSVLVLFIYLMINFFWGGEFEDVTLLNNLFYIVLTASITVSINYAKHSIVKHEAQLRAELEDARDALWTEMEVAKRIQTALLPNERRVGAYEVAALMVPADEVGGDYYDIIETRAGETWIAIGDASGHGVESGLIMMMTQTSIFTTVNQFPGSSPSSVLTNVNAVIKENLSRLGADRYVTAIVLRLDDFGFVFAGKHQDIILHRTRKKVTEFIQSKGTWLGIIDSIGEYLVDTHVRVDEGDIILLFTDGVTEASNARGEMLGERAIERLLVNNAQLNPTEIVLKVSERIRDHMSEQRDDYTIIVLKRKTTLRSSGHEVF